MAEFEIALFILHVRMKDIKQISKENGHYLYITNNQYGHRECLNLFTSGTSRGNQH